MNVAPLRNISNVTIKIVHGVRDGGFTYTNLLHGWVENGEQRRASSRMDGYLPDTPMNRAMQLEAFKRRRAR